MPTRTRVAIIAASSAVPMIELSLGTERLRSVGFTVDVQSQCRAQHFVFAGTDAERATAIYAAATSHQFDVLWCACGGYGAARVLPILDGLTAEHGKPPPKSLVGFSDVTALLSYVYLRWGWKTIHGSMPASTSFRNTSDPNWQSLTALVRGEQPAPPWGQWPLQWIGKPSTEVIDAELIGGNLSVWASLVGTPYAVPARERILFLEDLGEPPYRIDRMVNQLKQSGKLDGARAIILGGFTECDDRVSEVMAAAEGDARVPLRRRYEIDEALGEIFGGLGIPVAMGLPVGHGPHTTPLPLGVKYRLDVGGELVVLTS